jgi:DNA-binding transcriptional ArsR family regulator
VSDPGPIFAALADPTRRSMIDALLESGTTSVPELTGCLPISRQAVAKHLATLGEAGLVERVPGAGREVRYRIADGWDARLLRLKRIVEG